MTVDRFVPIGTEITTGLKDKGYREIDRQNTDSEQTVKRRTRRTESVKFFLGEEERETSQPETLTPLAIYTVIHYNIITVEPSECLSRSSCETRTSRKEKDFTSFARNERE